MTILQTMLIIYKNLTMLINIDWGHMILQCFFCSFANGDHYDDWGLSS